jgi:uncharacterized OB-fold protein
MSAVTLEAYQAALRKGALLVSRCASCGAQQCLPSDTCFTCGSDALQASHHDGAGRVFSWVVNHYAFAPELASQSPYPVVLIALDGGGRVYGRFEPASDAMRLRADLPVALDAAATAARGYPVYRIA